MGKVYSRVYSRVEGQALASPCKMTWNILWNTLWNILWNICLNGALKKVIYVFLFRMEGERYEGAFCDKRGLNMATMRTTSDAKNQLKELLISQVRGNVLA